MGEDLPGFRLRDLAPDDGPEVARLFDASPDSGRIQFRPEFQVHPYVALTYDGRQAGVVVERDGTDGIVGIGLVEIGDVVIRGRATPHALLHSLVVHPDARRKGVARAIVGWRLARAHATLGEDCVVVATIQKSNAGSFAAAARWATQFSSPISSIAIGLRSAAPPAARAGFRARSARPDDLEAFAAGHAGFHTDFDLWSPGGPLELKGWLAESPVAGTPSNALWVVEDAAGNVVAGLGTTEIRTFSVVHVDALPTSLRLVNMVLGVIPKSGSMEMVRISRMWFKPGAELAARHLFETVRWEARNFGNVVMASFDQRGPLRTMVVVPRWLPKTEFTIAIRAPERLRPDHPIVPVQ